MLGALVLAAFSLHARAWRFLCDDAFISFRYAENLAEHGALVFNVGVDPPEFVEGYTNFAWVVLLAVPAKFGLRPHEVAPIFTCLGALGGLVASAVLLDVLTQHRLRGPTAVALFVPAALLVASPEYIVWAHGGLETAATCTLVLAAMASWSSGRPVTAAAFAMLAAFCRVDALLPIALYGITDLLVRGGPALARGPKAAIASVPWRRLALALGVFAIPLGVHLLWRWSYYGAWVPNTWTIKAHGTLLRSTYGQAYVEVWVQHMHLWVLAPLALMLRSRHLIVVVPILGIITYGWWVGGDFMAYNRFYIVATALLATLVGWLLADASALIVRGRSPWWRAIPILAGVLLAGLLGREARARNIADRDKTAGWLDGRWEGVTTMDRFAKAGLAAGGWMHENLPASTMITVGAAGAVPYASRLPTIDAFGLVDPVIATLEGAGPRKDARARPGHQLMAPAKYIKSRDPDLLCHVGYRGKTRPRRAHPSFGRGYTWACMEPDPIPDPLSESGMLEVGFYCCRVRRNRTVGPFNKPRSPAP